MNSEGARFDGSNLSRRVSTNIKLGIVSILMERNQIVVTGLARIDNVCDG